MKGFGPNLVAIWWRRTLAVQGALIPVVLGALYSGCLLDIPERSVATVDASAPTDCKAGIEVRILVDATGGTKGVSVPYFFGEYDYLRELNAGGGIQGCPINIQFADYAYDPAKAQMLYDGWKASPQWDRVAAVFGFGSGDSLQLAPHAREDQKPLITASYFGSLGAPQQVAVDVSVPELDGTFVENVFPTHFTSDGFPYNFYAGTDYSTAIRIAMFYVRTQGGKRIGFFHCSAAYCTGPIPAGRAYAKTQSLSLGRDQLVELTATQDSYTQVVHDYFKAEFDHSQVDSTYTPVDWVWMGNTSTTTAYLAQAIANLANPQGTVGATDTAAERAYLATAANSVQIIANVWGVDETLYGLSPATVNRVHGIFPFTAFDDASRGSTEIKKVTALHDKWRAADAQSPSTIVFGAGSPSTAGPFRNVRYVQGYLSASLFRVAVDRVLAAGKPVTGPNIKDAFETFSGLDTGGLSDKLSFKPADHRPQATATIYKISASGALVPEPPSRTIALDPAWLGW